MGKPTPFMSQASDQVIRERSETQLYPCFKRIYFFLPKIIFFYVLDRFDTLISKIIF
jgi:hypothetical protein